MKVVLVVDGLWPLVIGGMEKHSFYLIRYLSAAGVQLRILHPHKEGEIEQKIRPLLSELEWSQIEWCTITASVARVRFPGHYVFSNYQFAKRVERYLRTRTGDADLIYAKGLTGWALLRRKDRYPLPIVVNAHGYEMFQPTTSHKAALQKLLLKPPFRYCLRRADYVVSYGGLITSLLQERVGLEAERILELPTGIAPEWIQTAGVEQVPGRVFCYLGRYEIRKGIEDLQSVLPEVLAHESAQMVFIGPIPEERQINHPRVHYLGKITDPEAIRKALKRCHFLVLPSHSEGMPNVVLEAMACGCAIIGTDVGAVRLMVDDQNGWLIPPFSSSDLAKAMLEAVSISDAAVQKLRSTSIEKIEQRFQWPQVAQHTIEVFKSVSEGSPKR